MGFRFAKAGAACALGLGLISLGACGSDVVEGTDSQGQNAGLKPHTDKVDILFVVDNTRAMADKQDVLAQTLADLVDGLANPPCVDASGGKTRVQRPTDSCPAGSHRAHTPTGDIHLGLISSSLGGHGSDSCPDVVSNDPVCAPASNTTNNDKAHLLDRTDQCGTTSAPTYQNKGFLVWDSNAPGGISDPAQLVATFGSMIRGVGQIGCGYPSQLESWYRFLADPAPYASVAWSPNNIVTPTGIDQDLLAQRAAFLRPDSMLVILMLSDEDDCSVREYGQFPYVLQEQDFTQPGAVRLPRPRQECATNPNDVCCKSCGQAPGNCPADPTCITADGQLARLSPGEDPLELRCFDQKRRFGIDFLYPKERYIQALTSPTVTDLTGELVPNPIFSGPGNARDPGMVVLAGIVGVPWQDIARNSADLTQGFKSSTELAQSNTWAAIVGDPSTSTPPTSPYMVQSLAPRPGVPANSPVNGGDWTAAGRKEPQYACIFPLPAPRDCSDPSTPGCDCEPSSGNPLCTTDASGKTLQVAAKVFPSTRQLSVLEGMGDQGVTTSICPAQLTDPQGADYAYRPAIEALLTKVGTRL
jgi:hypothetical protein